MAGRGLIGGLRRMAGFLAVLGVTSLILVVSPSHTEPPPGAAPAAAAVAHHPGDGDPDSAHHPPGAHCASHCAGHAAAPGSSPAPNVPAARRQQYAHTDDDAPATLKASPPIRPPAA